MRIVMFYPSLLSDWNNPSATGLRGVAMELLLRGHEVVVYEPRAGQALPQLLAEYGHGPVARFHATYPGLASRRYDLSTLNLDQALNGAQLVIVHADTDPALLRRLTSHRARCGDYRLLLHATQASNPAGGFDAVLAGSRPQQTDAVEVIAWPAAADTRVFKPRSPSWARLEVDVVWVGNCTDCARLDQLQEYFLRPVQRLGLKARIYGASFSPEALAAIEQAGVQFCGWVPEFELPAVYAACRVAVLMPPQGDATGQPDEHILMALACGVPVVSAAWDDADGLLRAGHDYAAARDGNELTSLLARVLADRQLAFTLAHSGRQAILTQHTVAQRVNTLLTQAQKLPAPRPMVTKLPTTYITEPVRHYASV